MSYPLPAEPGIYLEIGFIALSVAMVVGFGFVARSKLVLLSGGIWAAICGFVGYSAVLADFSTIPPRMMFLFLPTFAGVVFLAFSRYGKRLTNFSITFLVGFQSFRILVELLSHEAVSQGVAPPQMTWTGLNYDVLTGITALVLIPFASKLPKWALHAWNTAGFLLLFLVVAVAIASLPTAFQQLKPDNVWVAYFPFIWLPTILVSFALLGHLVLFRKLRFESLAEKEAVSDE